MNWMALILNNYNVEGVRRDVVAKAPAWYLEVRPKNPGRPSMRLWVDRETYLPLRQEVWSADGRLVKRTQALERPVLIRAGDLAPLKPPAVAGLNVVRWDQEYRMPEAAIASALGFPLARLPKAPRGFVLVGSYLSLSPGTFGACARWEMSDGIATVNIIQTRNDLGKVAHDDRGSTEQAESGLYHFVVGGNISRPELRRIANSIALQPR
jgi:negative regulator of sigma E activity